MQFFSYSPHRNDPKAGDTIGVLIEEISTGKKCWYSPGLGEIEPHLPVLMRQADCIMVDGTFWTNTEMIDMGLMTKTARSIGHNPQSGEGGMIEKLAEFGDVRKVLIPYRFSIAFLTKLTNLFKQNFCQFQLALPTWAFLVHSFCNSCQMLVNKKLIPINTNRYAALPLVVHPLTFFRTPIT